MDVSAFEKSVFDSLKKLLAERGRKLDDVKTLGIAVSGGADSVALLISLYEVCKKLTTNNYQLSTKIITVDHSIRPNGAGAEDAAFVAALCERIGVGCVVKKIPEGGVARAAKERGLGTEEAARHLRYKAFEEFAAETGAEFICLAHNKNDVLETLLMHFLQGSDAAGIAASRGMYLRPLLGISRIQIEEYLREKNIEWRTDATNSDNNYLRNKIRNKLVPFLDENFAGWQKAVLQGGEKAALQREALEQLIINNSQLTIEKGEGGRGKGTVTGNSSRQRVQDEIDFEAAEFGGIPIAVRQRAVYGALDRIGVTGRIPYGFVRTLSFWPEADFKKLEAAGVLAETKGGKMVLKKKQKLADESGFFCIIRSEGEFLFEKFAIQVKSADNNNGVIFVCGEKSVELKMSLPFVVRSCEIGDKVLTSGGAMKSVADIFSDWKIPESQRGKIPLIEVGGVEKKIAAVLGCVLGFDNWVVVN